jgi:hypothetical protein
MATVAGPMPTRRSDDSFFLYSAVAMALVVVAGFSMQLAAGRSTFAAPLRVHLHAVVFMGWVAIYVTQNVLATTGSVALHRRLGWLATGWAVAMVALGCVVTVALVRAGTVPFFFTPLQFLVLDPLAVITFAVLLAAGIAKRRRTDWHRRLNYCAMAMLLGPAFGRLVPLPLVIPYAFEVDALTVLIFPVIGVIADLRRGGVVHPAWRWGIGVIIGSAVLVEAITYGPFGLPLYRAVAAGSPGASVAPLEYPLPPAGPLRTGRPASI